MPMNQENVADVNTFGIKCLIMDLLCGVSENSRLDSKAVIIISCSLLGKTTLLIFL